MHLVPRRIRLLFQVPLQYGYTIALSHLMHSCAAGNSDLLDAGPILDIGAGSRVTSLYFAGNAKVCLYNTPSSWTARADSYIEFIESNVSLYFTHQLKFNFLNINQFSAHIANAICLRRRNSAYASRGALPAAQSATLFLL